MTSENRAIGGLAHRIRSDHRIAAIAVAGLLGAILAPSFATEAAASTRCENQDFSAIAAADLMKAELKNLELLGAESTTLAGVTVAAARSWVNSTEATKSRASVDYLDAELLGRSVPAGPLDASISQSAPPNNKRPATLRPDRLSAELLRLGPGPLSAHATWKREYGCRTAQGVIAESYGSDLDATVLPAITTKHEHAGSRLLGNSLISLPSNAFSRTATGLTRREGVMTTAATAWTGLAHLVLFGGTKRETTVRVVNPPELTALATGTKRSSAVEYTSPVLEVVTADGTSHRLDAPGEAFTLTVPPSGTPEVADDKAKPEHSPSKAPEERGLTDDILPDGDTAPDGTDRGLVGGILDGITGGAYSGDGGAGSGDGGAPEAGGEKSGAPAGDPEKKKPSAKDKAADREEAGDVPALTVRVSLGKLDSQITERSVRAEAASVRLQLTAVRGEKATTIGDVGLGMLKAYATAPDAPAPSNPPVATPPHPGGGGSLPTTGVNVLAVLAGGALLLVVGRFLMVLGRRSTAESPN